MGFIQPPPPHGFTQVLVMVYMFSPWTNALSGSQAAASTVVKILLEKKKIIPTGRNPL